MSTPATYCANSSQRWRRSRGGFMPREKPMTSREVSNRLPKASRPPFPREYGVSHSEKGLLPWSHVADRMKVAQHYWICTVSPKGHPHATPVDGLWLNDRLYFGGSPQSRRHRNLIANPAVCVHLESAMDVIILHGDAHE